MLSLNHTPDAFFGHLFISDYTLNALRFWLFGGWDTCADFQLAVVEGLLVRHAHRRVGRSGREVTNFQGSYCRALSIPVRTLDHRTLRGNFPCFDCPLPGAICPPKASMVSGALHCDQQIPTPNSIVKIGMKIVTEVSLLLNPLRFTQILRNTTYKPTCMRDMLLLQC